MASSRAIEAFNGENPSDWFVRMEASHELLQASSGQKIETKVFLLASMGSTASTLLSDLLAPSKISDSTVTYDKMKTTLIDHYKSQHLEMAERAQFYNATQLPDENAAQFFSRLKRLSEYCNFGSSLDSMLRDRMVLGCRSVEARRKLLQLEPLTLKIVQDTLLVFEAMNDARSGILRPDENTVHKVNKSSRQSKDYNRNARCFRCGKWNCHGKSQCPAIGKTCSDCGKPNHFQVACQSTRQPKKVNSVIKQ